MGHRPHYQEIRLVEWIVAIFVFFSYKQTKDANIFMRSKWNFSDYVMRQENRWK